MNVAACLLLYSFVAAVLLPRPLVLLTRTGRAPRLGVAAWLAAIGSVLASWVAAGLFLAGDLASHWNQPGRIASSCFEALARIASGGSGFLLQATLLTLTALTAGALGTVGWRLTQTLRRVRTHTHRHAVQARVVGRRVHGLDAVVLDAPERIAYCVAGRPGTIVVTTATLAALDDRHLRAVLAHEHAHLAGRHHHILAFTRALAATMPRMELFTRGARETGRLLEMCADDAAAHRHGPRTMLDALLALTAYAPVPHGALGSTGVDVVARAQRLALPAAPGARWRTRLLLSGMTVVVVGAPLFTGVLAATGMAMCDLLTR